MQQFSCIYIEQSRKHSFFFFFLICPQDFFTFIAWKLRFGEEKNPQNKSTQDRNISSHHSSRVHFGCDTLLSPKQQLKDTRIVSTVSTGD